MGEDDGLIGSQNGDVDIRMPSAGLVDEEIHGPSAADAPWTGQSTQMFDRMMWVVEVHHAGLPPRGERPPNDGPPHVSISSLVQSSSSRIKSAMKRA